MTFRGIVDLVEMEADVYYDVVGKDVRVEPIPDDMKELAQKYHNEMVEAAAETDEALMEKYLEEGIPLQGADIRAALRKATIANEIVPVCLRFFLPQQGRPEDAGCGRRLYALLLWISRPSDGVDPETGEEEYPHRRTTISRSPRWRSRS